MKKFSKIVEALDEKTLEPIPDFTLTDIQDIFVDIQDMGIKIIIDEKDSTPHPISKIYTITGVLEYSPELNVAKIDFIQFIEELDTALKRCKSLKLRLITTDSINPFIKLGEKESAIRIPNRGICILRLVYSKSNYSS
jgi:hypothetical protein